MTFTLSRRAVADDHGLSPQLQAAVDKQLALLIADIRHPSLRAKKYDEARNIWQARITRGYRVYFRMVGETYEIITITKHPQ